MKKYGIAALAALALIGGCTPLKNGPIAVATPVTEINLVDSKSMKPKNGIAPSVPEPGSASLGFSQDSDLISVTGSNITRTFEANGQDLVISGKGNRLKVRGRVHGLSVTGQDNSVQIENSLIVDVKGNGNSVLYAGATPVITKTGDNNQVTRSKS